MDEAVVFTEETINIRPGGTFIQEQLQGLRDDIDKLEAEREEMLVLLYEIVDAESIDDLDEIIQQIKSYIESRPFPAPY